MMAALERAALLLILILSLLADGLMEAFGPGVFIMISAITLSAAEALRLLAGIKRKDPCITADQSRMQETHTNHRMGAGCSNCTMAPSRKSRRNFIHGRIGFTG